MNITYTSDIYSRIFIIDVCIICYMYMCRAIRAACIDCIISIDTRRAVVAANAIAAGADLINDVSGQHTTCSYMHIYCMCSYTDICTVMYSDLYIYYMLYTIY